MPEKKTAVAGSALAEDGAKDIPVKKEKAPAKEPVTVSAAPKKPEPKPETSGTVWDSGPRTGGRYKLNEKGDRVRVK